MVIKRIYITLTIGLALLLNLRCKEPYVLPSSSANLNILVVEGIINSGDQSTNIRLSRTVNLTDTVKSVPELNAQVSVESDASPNGSLVMALTDQGGGNFTAFSGLNLDANRKYRLRIVTSNNKNYVSDFVPVKNSPPIDSLGFEVKGDGVYVYSGTHDPNNNTRYYRWDYTETWIVHSKYPSDFEAITNPKDTIISRPTQDQIYTCYTSDASSTIVLNSSSKLSQDVITHNLMAIVPSNSEKIRNEYCITVNQYALTEDAFNYWQNLKKNTEQLGSIFDAQPSQIKGNIHCVEKPDEVVLGFITAGAASQKRLFVGNSSVPQGWLRTESLPYDDCHLDSLYFVDPKTKTDKTQILYPGGEIPIGAIVNGQEVIIGYSASSTFCVDCRLRGTNIRPYFWIDKF